MCRQSAQFRRISLQDYSGRDDVLRAPVAKARFQDQSPPFSRIEPKNELLDSDWARQFPCQSAAVLHGFGSTRSQKTAARFGLCGTPKVSRISIEV
jgi:hypothetical protein